MKSIIFAFALIAAVSCDVSEIVQGDGWFKDETGYHYDVPQNKFFEDVPAAPEVVVADPLTVVDEPVYDPEEAAPGCPNGGSGPFCCINGSDSEDCGLPQDQIVEIIEYIDVPVNDLREYLPPKTEDAKKKRQALPRKRVQVRKVYRRFVKKH